LGVFQKNFTRREFLKVAAAGMAAPVVIPASVLGSDARPAPSDRIVVGLIGAGGMGNSHLRSLLGRGEVQVAAICDVDKKKRESAKESVEERYAKQAQGGTYKGCAAYNDFRELLDRDDIDAIVVATPDHWHALICIAAAKAGKDVYCEKPLSLTIREAREMVNAVRRHNRIFQTGSQQRSSSGFRTACELVRNGRIGKVISANVGVGGPSGDCYLPAQPVPPGLDWDLWLGPAPWRPFNKGIHPYSWREYRDYSGGQMTNWGSHHFDIVQWALDMDNSGPVEVVPPDGKDVKLLTYRYANGVNVYHGGFTGKGSGILFTGARGKIWVSRSYLRAEPEEILKQPTGLGEVHLYRSKNHHDNWMECIRSRQRPICDVEVGCRSVTVCHVGNLAYWLKRPLKWDPVKEEFVGDDEANRWLDRPKRAPWTV
jgi:predicted dehydrogenase